MTRSIGATRTNVRRLAAACLLVCGTSLMANEAPEWLHSCIPHGDNSSVCFEPYTEGLAAIRTVSKDHPLSGLWGFIDTQGRLAISPRFEWVLPFRQGVAAAMQGEKWGYINRDGEWVIPPQFKDASHFTPKGFAFIQDETGRHVIDRQGQRIKSAPHVNSYWPPGLNNGLDEVDYQPPMQLWSRRTGKSIPLPAAVQSVALPSDGLIPAARLDSRYGGPWGALNPDLSWAATPEQLRSSQPPLHHAGIFLVEREGMRLFVNAQGEPLSNDVYRRAELVSPGVWSVDSDHKNTQLLDAKLQPLFTVGELGNEAPYLHWMDEGPWRVATQPKGLLLVNKQGLFVRLPHANAKATYRHGKLWITQTKDSDQDAGFPYGRTQLIQAYDDRGQPQLSPETLKQLASSDANLLTDPHEGARSGWLVAALSTPNLRPPSLLTSDGKILTSSTWTEFAAAPSPSDEVVAMRDENQQTLLVGKKGLVAGPLPLQLLDRFESGVTWARTITEEGQAARIVVLSESGRIIDIPDRLRRHCDRQLIGGRLTCSGGAQERSAGYHLWNPLTGERSELDFDEIEPIRHLHTHLKAKSKEKWGVIDLQGRWVIPPVAAWPSNIERLTDHIVDIQASNDKETLHHLHDLMTGRAITGPLDSVRTLPDGSLMAMPKKEAPIILDATGKTTLKLSDAGVEITENENWLVATPPNLKGLMDGSGTWVVPPAYGSIQRHGDAKVMYQAVRVGDSSSEILDEQGKLIQRLADGESLSVGYHLIQVRNYTRQTTFFKDFQWQTVADQASGIGLQASQGHGADTDTPDIFGDDETGLLGFLDKSGRPKFSAVFDRLDHLRNGLSLAMHRNKHGAKWGYVDSTGRFAIPARYDVASAFNNERALVVQKGQMSVIDTRGEVMARFDVRCGQFVIHDREGKQSWPQSPTSCNASMAAKKGKRK